MRLPMSISFILAARPFRIRRLTLDMPIKLKRLIGRLDSCDFTIFNDKVALFELIVIFMGAYVAPSHCIETPFADYISDNIMARYEMLLLIASFEHIDDIGSKESLSRLALIIISNDVSIHIAQDILAFLASTLGFCLFT